MIYDNTDVKDVKYIRVKLATVQKRKGEKRNIMYKKNKKKKPCPSSETNSDHIQAAAITL
jgi:hypothetical protein